MLDLHPVFSLQKLKVSCNEVIIMSPVFLILARLQSNSPKRLSEGEKPSRRSCHRTSAFIRTCANVIRITPYRPFANDRLSPEEFDWTQCFPPAWLSFSKHKRENASCELKSRRVQVRSIISVAFAAGVWVYSALVWKWIISLLCLTGMRSIRRHLRVLTCAITQVYLPFRSTWSRLSISESGF